LITTFCNITPGPRSGLSRLVPQSTVPPPATYNLVARYSGKLADVFNQSTGDGANVVQWACHGGTNQQWRVQDAGGSYVNLIARHSGKCLAVSGASTADGAQLVQWTCNGATDQQWQRRAV
jgi:alpha-galactosidase